MADGLRILGVVGRPLPLAGGAEITMATLLARLQRDFGHTARLVGQGVEPAHGQRRGLSILAVRDREELGQVFRRFRPDVVISALDHSISAAALCERFGVPHVVSVHSFELCPPDAGEIDRWQVGTQRDYLPRADRRRILDSAAVVLANSRFMQRRLLRLTGTHSRVVYPPFDRKDYVPSGPPPDGQYITAACGYGHKGADIFLALAERMPERQFLLAGRTLDPWRTQAARLPNVRLLPFGPTRHFLEMSRVVLMPSQWPEPFGRVAVEAMLYGRPAIASATGGLPEAIGSAGRLVTRFRSVGAWQAALEALLDDENLAAGLAARGRRHAERFAGNRFVARTDRLLRQAAGAGAARWPARTMVILSGDDRARSAFALVNRQWSKVRSARAAQVVPLQADAADCALADVHVRHDLARRFEEWKAPPTGHLVAVRTWDFGPYPKAWVDAINAQYDALWVHTRWIRRQAIEAGVDPRRIRLVPLGVDLRVFTPRGPRRRWPGPRTFNFLFVGAPVARKGIDILLTAYLRAFTRRDRVRLILKAHPDDVFYRGADARNDLRAAMASPEAPQIVVIDEFLPEQGLAALYRSADACVFPYRAEGFCLPILEAMACGRPCLVPDFGAALDFCRPATSFMVPARRIAVPVGRRFAINTLGFEQEIDAVDFCEIDVDVMAAALRRAAATPGIRLRRMGGRARRASARFSWEHSLRTFDRAIAHVLRRPVPVRVKAARAAAQAHQPILAAARALYVDGR